MSTFFDAINNLFEIQEFETLFQLVLILILSGFVGYERESWNKPAGFRTHLLVGISAVLVMACGKFLHDENGLDMTRIPAQLLSGIGFIGAGTILRDGFNVKGLTTAAGLLAVTCVGLAVGAGYYIGAIIATAIIYAVLSYSHVLSKRLDHFNFLDIEITVKNPKTKMDEIRKVLKELNSEIVKMNISDEKEKDDLIKVVLRCKEQIDVNQVFTKIMEIDEVTGVVEVK